MSEKDDFQMDDNFADFVKDLEEREQPSCDLDNPEDCEACGS